MKTLTKIFVLLFVVGISACEPNDAVEPTPPSDGDLIEPNVGGPDQPNQVFIDLSTGLTTVSPRIKWDLAFSTSSEFGVILNYSAFMSARPTDKIDLSEVTSELVTDEYKAEMSTGPDCDIAWVDDPSGDLSKTAFGSISSTIDDNVVFVVNRGYTEINGAEVTRGHVKVRITREGDNYSISYGDIEDNTFTTLTIPKNAKYNFTYLSFDDGILDVEPEKELWDIVMTTGTLLTAFGPGAEVPYNFDDLSLSNYLTSKVSAVDVTESITYESFNYDNIVDLTLENNRTAIGSSWRKFNGDIMNPGYDVSTVIFYVIEDPAGNYYKLRFTRMNCIEAACAGERGYPEFTYELLKQE